MHVPQPFWSRVCISDKFVFADYGLRQNSLNGNKKRQVLFSTSYVPFETSLRASEPSGQQGFSATSAQS